MLNIQSIDSWITTPKANPQADLRLFCFPYAGGSSIIFRRWLDKVPGNIEICPIELPGRGTKIKLAPLNKLELIVEALALQIQPYLDKPFAFFGHSMGGLISFELVRLLRKKYSMMPNHLFISARCAPQIPNSEPPIHALPESDFIAELRRYNGTPEAVLENQELMQLFMPILRADFAVLESYIYHPAPPLECPISVFGALEDHKVSVEKLEAWREQTNSYFSLDMLSGDHFFINDSYPLLIEKISEKVKK
ncbi:MAG: thioesterase II family protein [Nostocaceae cyanobacterium]|nr:thioesterase II family protein [Nostocaceae cyanobacterium]